MPLGTSSAFILFSCSVLSAAYPYRRRLASDQDLYNANTAPHAQSYWHNLMTDADALEPLTVGPDNGSKNVC